MQKQKPLQTGTVGTVAGDPEATTVAPENAVIYDLMNSWIFLTMNKHDVFYYNHPIFPIFLFVNGRWSETRGLN